MWIIRRQSDTILNPQGEAVGWAYDGSGYYTVGEEVFSIPAHLYFYPRISTSIKEENNIQAGFKIEKNYPNPSAKAGCCREAKK